MDTHQIHDQRVHCTLYTVPPLEPMSLRLAQLRVASCEFRDPVICHTYQLGLSLNNNQYSDLSDPLVSSSELKFQQLQPIS